MVYPVTILVRKRQQTRANQKNLKNYGGHHVVYDDETREISDNPKAGDASVKLNCGIKVNIPACSIKEEVTVEAIGLN